MKRSGPPKRKKGLRKTAPPRVSSDEIDQHRMFIEAARVQPKRQVADDPDPDGPWDPHHAVKRQHLDDRGLPPYDVRNAFRCSRAAHDRHEFSPTGRIKTRELRDENVAYAFEVLGAGAIHYLRRYYDDTTDPDPRLPAHASRS